jgi:hypothetical protein
MRDALGDVLADTVPRANRGWEIVDGFMSWGANALHYLLGAPVWTVDEHFTKEPEHKWLEDHREEVVRATCALAEKLPTMPDEWDADATGQLLAPARARASVLAPYLTHGVAEAIAEVGQAAMLAAFMNVLELKKTTWAAAETLLNVVWQDGSDYPEWDKHMGSLDESISDAACKFHDRMPQLIATIIARARTERAQLLQVTETARTLNSRVLVDALKRVAPEHKRFARADLVRFLTDPDMPGPPRVSTIRRAIAAARVPAKRCLDFDSPRRTKFAREEDE